MNKGTFWVALVCFAASVRAEDPPDSEESSEVIEVHGSTTPGSEHSVKQEELERYQRDDIHKVLSSVPGVYVREEDGYGLRPNIGMRGAAAERSAKIALLEDGILIAPAPYSAPAAYYFPLVARMSRIDVLKGPSAILYGPNTVGGAINLISRPVPDHRFTFIDIAGGQDLYGKVHLGHAEAGPRFGVMVEGAKLRTDGFKRLDTGGDTGFDKNDVVAKLRLNTNPSSPRYHRLDVSAGYADETANETYTGLSRADLEATPYRRYAGTQLDRYTNDHQRYTVGYEFESGNGLHISTQLYQIQFDRIWRKLNGFDGGNDLYDVLVNPNTGNNQVYYSVLTGQTDSTGEGDALLIGTNNRSFLAQGIQTNAVYEFKALGLQHQLSAGLRLHRDRARRLHVEDPFLMTSKELVPQGGPTRINRNATGAAQALAGYLEEKVTLGPVEISAGTRVEVIRTLWRDRQTPSADNHDVKSVLIPGIGAYYRATPWLGVLAGVHKGFVPGAPAPGGTAEPEQSINYEFGLRAEHSLNRIEAIGFFNDYSNIKGSDERIDAEFAGGKVYVYGLESQAETELWRNRTLSVPVALSYTFTSTQFRTSFQSDNPEWGKVMAGDELPYIPEHQLTASIGARNRFADLFVSGRYIGAMRDSAGQGPIMENVLIPASTVVDVATHARFGDWGELYLTASNIFDEATVVSLRPFGARPGAPRRFILGYKNDF